MGDRLGHKPDQLSGGQKQRVAIARALVGEPSVVLADEPTGALDSDTADEVMESLIRLNREELITIVIITHDPLIARQCARKTLIRDGALFEGRRRAVGRGDAMRSRGPAPDGHSARGCAQSLRRQVAHAARPHRHHDRHRLGDRHDLDGEIATAESRNRFEALGTDILTIEKAGTPAQGRDAAIGLEAALALEDALPTIALAAPQIEAQGSFAYGGKSVGQGLTHASRPPSRP